MSIDEFFDSVDIKINKDETEKQNQEKAEKDLREFFEKAVEEFLPTLQEYVERLKQRNIKCESKHATATFSFTMYYKDGGHRGLTFGGDYSATKVRYSFFSDFTNDDGKNYTSTDAMSFTQDNWSEAEARKRVESEIESFLFYADRHGGF
jgi:hypothetical protein